jgi:hypothetical protein
MKRIKINTTFEEGEEERRRFFAALSYSERLRYFFEQRNKYYLDNPVSEKKRIFKIYHSFDEK